MAVTLLAVARADRGRRVFWPVLAVAWTLALALLSTLSPAPSLAAAATAQRAGALLDWQDSELALIAAHGPWPQPVERDSSNALDQPTRPPGSGAGPAGTSNHARALAFGQQLFLDARLSVDGQLSCASCHVPGLAFQDGRKTPVLRSGSASGKRNTPSLLDVAGWRWFGWDGAQDSLWAASLSPLLDPTEMGHTPASLAQTIRRDPALASGWRAAMGRQIPDDDEAVAVGVAKSLAIWQASLISPRTPFDDFRDAILRGDRAAAARYPLAAQRGLRLFIGPAQCHFCHAGPRFSNGEFADVGRPFFLPGGGVDGGRHGGLRKLRESLYNRLGPHADRTTSATASPASDTAAPSTAAINSTGHVDPRAMLTAQATLEPRHFGEFRVPSLRQLAFTAPYWHDGSGPDLAEVLSHYNKLNEDRLHADGERILRRLDFSPDQLADLEAFLNSLSSTASAQATPGPGGR
jgi:cytochrome c peroxidase